MSLVAQVSGLRTLKVDHRDIPLGGIFGHIDIKDVPNTDFIVAQPLKIKDQKDSDFCTAYTVTEVSEDQEGVELNPHFQYAAFCSLRGNFTEWGGDLRTACASAVKIGSLEESLVPAFMREAIERGDRNFVADWRNWPDECFQLAKNRAKGSYFSVDGPNDTFDNIRAAMWQFRAENRSIAVGSMWRSSWTEDADGIVKNAEDQGLFGHAFKIFGQKVINDELHLCAQLSNGPVGDNGIYYFTREVVNTEFGPFGQFMFQDLPKETAQFYQKHGIKAKDGTFTILWKIIKNYLKYN